MDTSPAPQTGRTPRFNVTDTGIGTKVVNVGSNGGEFGSSAGEAITFK